MRKGGGLTLRTVTAFVALSLVLALIWAPGLRLVFSLFVVGLAAVGLYEYYAIVRAAKVWPETTGGIVAGVLVALSGHTHSLCITAHTFCGACLLVAALHMVRGRNSIEGLATSVFGVFYVGWLPAHMLLLRGIPGTGAALTTLLLLAVALTDAGAYFAGKTLGRHKMAPVLSPNKTWEGAVGGLLITLLGMALFYLVSNWLGWPLFPKWSLPKYLGIGIVLSILAQVGDLTESYLKRSAGVKDSGGLFPGHGGVLDRCDGYLFAAPALYYMVAPLV